MLPYDMRVSHSGEAKLLLTAIYCLLYFIYMVLYLQKSLILVLARLDEDYLY